MFPRIAFVSLCVFLQSVATQAGEKESPHTDHYGDPLPKGVRFRLGTTRLRHDGDVMALAWLPDGRTLASAGWDCTVRLWQIPGGKQIAQWNNLGGVVFSPDGRTLACGVGRLAAEENRAIRIVDVVTGKERRRIRVPKNGGMLFNWTPGRHLGFYSPNGKIFALRGAEVYAVDSGKQLGVWNEKVIEFGRPLVFSPDSRELIVTTGKGTYRWTLGLDTKERILKDVKKTAYSFAFSPDGKILAAAIRDFVTLRSWPAGKEVRRLPMRDDPRFTDYSGSNRLTFAPNGKLLATSAEGIIRLWNPATGKQVRRFEGHRGNPIWDLAFSPDGSLLATAGRDGAVVVWEVDAAKKQRMLTGVRHWLDLAGLTADGQKLLTLSADGTLTHWDSRNGRRLHMLANGKDSADKILFGRAASRTRVLLRQESRQAIVKERICCSAFSPDNAMLAIGDCNDGRILLLHKTDNSIEQHSLNNDAPVRKMRKAGYTVSVSRLTFSPDGRTLAACYSDGRLILWNPRTARPRHRLSFPGHGESYQYLAFSPDGRLLALSDRASLYLVEVASGQQLRQLPFDRAWIDSLAFAPDNRTLAFGNAADIHLWDVPTDKQISILRGHRDSVRTLLFSLDGTSLFSGGDDNTVLCWDVADILRPRASAKELTAAQLTALWKDLASNADNGQRAVAELIQSPDSALPFLEKSLPPVPQAKMTRIAAWIADLDSEEYVRREKASRELKNLGESAVPALRKTMKTKPTLEVRKRIQILLETIGERPPSPERLRILRALQTLESIATPKARRLVEKLAGGAAGAQLTEEAKASAQRLARRFAKPQHRREGQP